MLASAQVVTTDLGKVKGQTADGITSFKGIPFAAPPTGNLRWVQRRLKTAWWEMSGAPEHHTGKLPVLVWIYGGGWVNGGSSPAVYDGNQFAKHGILFYSFNYRVGRFGFFAHAALTARATLAVARKLVAYLLAVDRSHRPFIPAENFSSGGLNRSLRDKDKDPQQRRLPGPAATRLGDGYS